MFEVGDLVKASDAIGLIIEKTAMKHTHGHHTIWWYSVDFFDESEFEPRLVSEIILSPLDK